jgi:hypothetical protein
VVKSPTHRTNTELVKITDSMNEGSQYAILYQEPVASILPLPSFYGVFESSVFCFFAIVLIIVIFVYKLFFPDIGDHNH